MKDKKFEKTMTSIFDGILDGIAKETLEKYPELIKKLSEVEEAEEFNLSFMYQIRNCVDRVIAQKIGKLCPSPSTAVHKISFLYMNYRFVESHIEYVVKKLEGMACSADKSRYIIRAYEKYFLDGIPLGLPRDEKKDENCYWKPRFWNDEEWLEFLDTLISMYYGDFTRYGIFIKQKYVPLLEKLEKERKENKNG